jgi:hypothetical protein
MLKKKLKVNFFPWHKMCKDVTLIFFAREQIIYLVRAQPNICLVNAAFIYYIF